MWMPTNDETSLNLPKLISKSPDQRYDVMPPHLPLTSQIPKNHKNSTESSMKPSFFWAFSSAWCSCLLVISVEMRIYDLSWYEGHAVDFPMLRLHPGLGRHILSDKNKKYGTAADSVLCAEWVEESFGKKLPSATKKTIPCLYSHAVHRYAIFWEKIDIDIKSLFLYKLHTVLQNSTYERSWYLQTDFYSRKFLICPHIASRLSKVKNAEVLFYLKHYGIGTSAVLFEISYGHQASILKLFLQWLQLSYRNL